MPYDVGHRLLHDAERRQVDVRGQFAPFARPVQMYAHPGGARHGGEPLDVRQPGCCGRPLAGSVVLRVPQRDEHAAQARQGLPALVLDRRHRLARGLGPGRGDAGRRARLEGDDADAVGDRVVHLPCYAQAFGGDGLFCGTGGELFGVRTAAVGGVAEQPGDQRDESDGEFGRGADDPAVQDPYGHVAHEQGEREGDGDDSGTTGRPAAMKYTAVCTARNWASGISTAARVVVSTTAAVSSRPMAVSGRRDSRRAAVSARPVDTRRNTTPSQR